MTETIKNKLHAFCKWEFSSIAIDKSEIYFCMYMPMGISNIKKKCTTVTVEPSSEQKIKAEHSPKTVVPIIYQTARITSQKTMFILTCYNFTCITIILHHSFVP
jgi:hypothetical protein